MKLWIVGVNGLLGSSLKNAVPISVGSSKTEADVTSLPSLRSFMNRHPGITHIINASAFSLVDLAEKQNISLPADNEVDLKNILIVKYMFHL